MQCDGDYQVILVSWSVSALIFVRFFLRLRRHLPDVGGEYITLTMCFAHSELSAPGRFNASKYTFSKSHL